MCFAFRVYSFCYCLPSSLSCTVEGGIHPPSLMFMWSVYFDDFLCLARSSESKHVDFCVDALFSLLGWRISKNKLLGFNTLCKVLGVQLDLRQSGDRLCFVTNTEQRVEELVNELDEALRAKILPRSEGEKVRGRLQFGSSQVFGRNFRRLLKVMSNHVTQGGRRCLSTLKHASVTFASY